MQPTLSTISPPQERLRRFVRQPEKLGGRRITDKTLAALAIIERYRIIPSSLLIRLMPGNQRNNYNHLQTLFHLGLANRFALPKYGGPGEHIHYLDSKTAIDTLVSEGLLPDLTDQQRKRKEEIIRYNREHDYAKLHRDINGQGKLPYVQHELMISRFHFMLEMACRKFPGQVFLEHWSQGSELWRRVEVPEVRPDHYDDRLKQTVWHELAVKAWQPHRPDAFFTLYFPGKPEGRQRSHFLYEADRGTENTTRYKMKMRVHYHAIVRQQLQRQAPYQVDRIRAVLTETTEPQWADTLREAAKENVVAGKPSPLFWFTSSRVFTGAPGLAGREYLQRPEAVFDRVWFSPTSTDAFDLSAD